MRNLLTVGFVVIYLIALTTFGKMYLADIQLAQSEELLLNGKTQKALDKINAAIKNNPQEPKYYRHRAKISVTATLGQKPETQKQLKDLAVRDLEKGRSLNPKNLATLRNSAPIYFFLGNKDLSQPATTENIDTSYLFTIENYFNQIKNYNDTDVGLYVLSAKYEKRLEMNDGYNESVEKIKELRPDLLDWHEDLVN